MIIDPPDMTGGDALGETIGGMFDIPEMDIENQLVEISSGEGESTPNKIQPTPTENSDATSDLGDLF